MFLRNQFSGVGMFSVPLIKKQEVRLEDFALIGYDKINQSNETGKTVHFFIDDYRFESIYKNPDDKIERLKKFNAVLSPDFSMYTEMPVALQLYNCFRNRWTGAYLQQNGITVIPTVRWGSLESFNFCFDGIEKGFYIKKFYGFITPIQKGAGSALGRNSTNPKHEFDENTDMPPFT